MLDGVYYHFMNSAIMQTTLDPRCHQGGGKGRGWKSLVSHGDVAVRLEKVPAITVSLSLVAAGNTFSNLRAVLTLLHKPT
jgi:hypothetical protein